MSKEIKDARQSKQRAWPEVSRRTAYKKFIKGHTTSRISKDLNIPKGTVDTWCRQERWPEARKKLRKESYEELSSDMMFRLMEGQVRHIRQYMKLLSKGQEKLMNAVERVSVGKDLGKAIRQLAVITRSFRDICKASEEVYGGCNVYNSEYFQTFISPEKEGSRSIIDMSRLNRELEEEGTVPFTLIDDDEVAAESV